MSMTCIVEDFIVIVIWFSFINIIRSVPAMLTRNSILFHTIYT